MLICPQCGWRVRRGARFCAQCGARLGERNGFSCGLFLICVLFVMLLLRSC